jgi:hypothetical protein
MVKKSTLKAIRPALLVIALSLSALLSPPIGGWRGFNVLAFLAVIEFTLIYWVINLALSMNESTKGNHPAIQIFSASFASFIFLFVAAAVGYGLLEQIPENNTSMVFMKNEFISDFSCSGDNQNLGGISSESPTGLGSTKKP